MLSIRTPCPSCGFQACTNRAMCRIRGRFEIELKIQTARSRPSKDPLIRAAADLMEEWLPRKRI